MKILKAKVLGLCMGVRRAHELALSEAQANKDSRLFTLGPLAHNPFLLADLKKRGIDILAELPQNLENTTVIIRAHGISPARENELREKGAKIIDATCPKVKNSQEKARSLARAGYGLFLAGEKEHAEIEGILGYAEDARFCAAPFCAIACNAEEAETQAAELKRAEAAGKGFASKGAKTALLGQTTISEEEYGKIAFAIRKHFPDLLVCGAICSATKDRQAALRELLDNVCAVIVAGGKESANTKRLFAIAKESGKPCCLIESAAEIPPEFYGFETVGLSAGASTPDCVIDEIEKQLTVSSEQVAGSR